MTPPLPSAPRRALPICFLLLSACDPTLAEKYAADPAPVCLDPAPAQPAFAWTDTWRSTRQFQVFDYQFTPDQARAAAARYEFFWGSTHAAEISAAKPDAIVSLYIPFHRDPEKRTFAEWQRMHPDWILYQCDRKTPVQHLGDPNLGLDISNPEVVAWQVGLAAEAQKQGYNALAADNLHPYNIGGACGVYRNGEWVPLYDGTEDDALHKQHVIEWSARMREGLHALPVPMRFIGNLEWVIGDPAGEAIATNLDALVDESIFVSASPTPLVGQHWINRSRTIRCVQSSGRAYFGIGYAPHKTAAERTYIVASFLLARERRATIYMGGPKGYGDEPDCPECALPIGAPCGPLAARGNVYSRDFSRGLVVVNATNGEESIDLPLNASFRDAGGAPVTGPIKLPPIGAAIFVSDQPRCAE